MKKTHDTTLTEAQDAFFYSLPDGTTCPCCGRFGKLYKRKINQGMARILLDLARAAKQREPGAWIDIRRLKAFKPGAGDYAYLRFWGLIEQLPSDNAKQRSSGYWRLTDKGYAFVRGEIEVPSHALVFDNRLMGFVDKTIRIEGALRSPFDYAELMEA